MNKWRAHLHETNWTYWQHLRHSIEVCSKLVYIAFMSILHGLIPGFWANRGPVGIYRIYKNMRRLPHARRLFNAEEQKDQNKQ